MDVCSSTTVEALHGVSNVIEDNWGVKTGRDSGTSADNTAELNALLRSRELEVCECEELGRYGWEWSMECPATSLCMCMKIVFANIKFTNRTIINEASILLHLHFTMQN